MVEMFVENKNRFCLVSRDLETHFCLLRSGVCFLWEMMLL